MRPGVILPTYEERVSVGDLLADLRARLGPAARILVVDDGSPDGTGRLVRDLMRQTPASR